MTTSTERARRKGDLQHYVKGIKTYKIKYKIIYNIWQITAMNKIPQKRQQRRPSGAPAGRAGLAGAPVLPLLWYFIHIVLSVS